MIRDGDAHAVRIGFFGKLPSRGDFVRMGLSRALVTAWDSWLQEVMPVSRCKLGGAFGKAVADTPAWRFAFSAGVCGPRAVCGLWLPSVDRVGRMFPLLIAAESAMATDAFLDAAERIGVDAIRDAMTPARLALHLSKAPRPLPAVSATLNATRWWRKAGAVGTHELRGNALPDANTFLRMLTA